MAWRTAGRRAPPAAPPRAGEPRAVVLQRAGNLPASSEIWPNRSIAVLSCSRRSVSCGAAATSGSSKAARARACASAAVRVSAFPRPSAPARVDRRRVATGRGSSLSAKQRFQNRQRLGDSCAWRPWCRRAEDAALWTSPTASIRGGQLALQRRIAAALPGQAVEVARARPDQPLAHRLSRPAGP